MNIPIRHSPQPSFDDIRCAIGPEEDIKTLRTTEKISHDRDCKRIGRDRHRACQSIDELYHGFHIVADITKSARLFRQFTAHEKK
jgi:hypothetical protein